MEKIKRWLAEESAENMNGVEVLFSGIITLASFIIPLLII